MNHALLIRLLLCIFSFGAFLYSYIDQQNDLTELRICLPELAKDVRTIKEENIRLQYEIEQFENPQHLMELSRHTAFTHLKHPLVKDVATCQEGIAMQMPSDKKQDAVLFTHKPTLATGAK